eukprot:RCo029769
MVSTRAALSTSACRTNPHRCPLVLPFHPEPLRPKPWKQPHLPLPKRLLWKIATHPRKVLCCLSLTPVLELLAFLGIPSHASDSFEALPPSLPPSPGGQHQEQVVLIHLEETMGPVSSVVNGVAHNGSGEHDPRRKVIVVTATKSFVSGNPTEGYACLSKPLTEVKLLRALAQLCAGRRGSVPLSPKAPDNTVPPETQFLVVDDTAVNQKVLLLALEL